MGGHGNPQKIADMVRRDRDVRQGPNAGSCVAACGTSYSFRHPCQAIGLLHFLRFSSHMNASRFLVSETRSEQAVISARPLNVSCHWQRQRILRPSGMAARYRHPLRWRSSFTTLSAPTAIAATPMPMQSGAIVEFMPITIQATPTPMEMR